VDAAQARREKISERMKILQDLVPGCNKVLFLYWCSFVSAHECVGKIKKKKKVYGLEKNNVIFWMFICARLCQDGHIHIDNTMENYL